MTNLAGEDHVKQDKVSSPDRLEASYLSDVTAWGLILLSLAIAIWFGLRNFGIL